MPRLIALPFLAAIAAAEFVHAQAPTEPAQVPLCMVGDSITWAQEGDWWRAYLLDQIPSLAFVGTHSAALGYSHAGEGGNGTAAVLQRLPDIPDCPYYSLLIGTNDGAAVSAGEQHALAQACAERTLRIVEGLLAKPGTLKVFLGSILPCQTDAPQRDETNRRVNAILQPQVKALFPDGRVVWVDYEHPIRAIRNWGPIIQLHPTKVGYRLIATILAQTLRDELRLGDRIAPPKPTPGAGVRVENLWQGDATNRPIIAGWYTVSFDVQAAAPGATLTLNGAGQDPKQTLALTFKVAPDTVGTRLTWNVMTGYAGYGYTTGVIRLSTDGCAVGRVLFEKRRPSGLASAYGVGNYLDTTNPIGLGERVEK